MKKRNLANSLLTVLAVAGIMVPSAVVLAETTSSTAAETTSSSVAQSSEATSTESTVASESQTSTKESETEESTSSTETPEAEVTEEAKAENTVPVQMLGINDFHGALNTTGSFYGLNGTVRNAGTAALLAAYLNNATSAFKTANPDGASIRVQSGDMVGASPAASGLLQDQPTMRVLQQMGFAVGTLGNHEFDEGLAEFNRILLGAKPAEPNNFYDIVKQYNNSHTQAELAGGFEMVIANVKDATGQNPFGWKDYTVKDLGNGVKVGYIGVVTTEIPNLVLAEYHKDYQFTDPAAAIVKASKELRGQGVNAIVVLGHTMSVQAGEDGVSGESADIMNQVNSQDPDNSVDAYFAGHNHVATSGVVGKTRIVQSTSQGKGYVDLQGEYDTEKADFVEAPTATVNAVDPEQGVTPDGTVQATVTEAENLVKAVTDEAIGTADETMTRTVNTLGESPVGNLITDGQIYMAKKANIDADFAITNNGGIRADLEVVDGKITWGAAQAVQPFGNIMQIVEMSGEQIRTVLNQQTFSWDFENDRYNGYFLQVGGMKYTITDNPDKEDTDHMYVVDRIMKEDGTELDPAAKYKVVINDFLFGGGDGFAEFTNATLVTAMQPDTETFVGYIQDIEARGEKVTAPAVDRKTYLTAAEIAARDESEQIATATLVDPVTEGDPAITGKTIPNATVAIASIKRTENVSVTADEKGEFSIDAAELDLKADDVITLTVTGPQGGTGTVETTVLAKEGTPTEETETSTTESSKEAGKNDSGQKLPQAGSETNVWLMISGVVIIGGTGAIVVKRKMKA